MHRSSQIHRSRTPRLLSSEDMRQLLLLAFTCAPVIAYAQDRAQQEFARAIVDSAVARRSDFVASHLHSRLRDMPGMRDSLAAALDAIPTPPIDSFRLIGFHTVRSSDGVSSQ